MVASSAIILVPVSVVIETGDLVVFIFVTRSGFIKVAFSVDPVLSRITSFKCSNGVESCCPVSSCANWKPLHVDVSRFCFQVCLVVPLLRFLLGVDLVVTYDLSSSSLVSSSVLLSSLSSSVPLSACRFCMALLTDHCSRGITVLLSHVVLR